MCHVSLILVDTSLQQQHNMLTCTILTHLIYTCQRRNTFTYWSTSSLTLSPQYPPFPHEATCRDGKCERVTLTNVPSFVAGLDIPITIGDRTIKVDVAYGGAFFAIVDATQFNLTLGPGDARRCVELGEEIKAAVAKAFPVVHPDFPEIHTVTFVEFTLPITQEPSSAGAGAGESVLVGRNAVVVSLAKSTVLRVAQGHLPGLQCCMHADRSNRANGL